MSNPLVCPEAFAVRQGRCRRPAARLAAAPDAAIELAFPYPITESR